MAKKHISPHDRYIRSVMSNPKVVKEFFEKNLPSHVLSSIDLSTIVPQKDSFVDDKLRLKVVDLLYSVNIQGEPGYLYVLMEHASTPDKMLPYRLLKYMIAIMDNHLTKTGSKTLPMIYPLVLYTGENPYTYSTDLFELFGTHRQIAQEILCKPYQLIDLSRFSDEQLEEYYWFKAAALLTKHIHDNDLLPFFKRFLVQLKELEKQGELDYIYVSLTYIIEAGEVSSKQEFFNAIRSLESIDEEKIMTIAEQLKKEGYRQAIEQNKDKWFFEGRQEGRQEEKKEIARQMLAENISLEMISRVTGFSIEALQKLKH